MSKFQDISGELLAIANLPPEKRNSALSDLSVLIQGLPDYEIIQDKKDLITSIIESLIAENDADQIAKSKLVFVEDVEEQIAPTKKTRAKKVVTPTAQVESVVTPSAKVESEDLPDFIEKLSLVKDLPEPVKKLIGLRRMQQATTTSIGLEDIIMAVLDWTDTPEGYMFWNNINFEGDLREFKAKFGNKGEKVDELIEFAELSEFVENEFLNPTETATAPVVNKQKLIFLSLIFYPPVGSSIQLDLYNPVELHSIVLHILDKLNVNDLTLSFDAVTDFSSYITKVKLYGNNSTNEMVDTLMEQFDTFVTPELDWSDFANNGTDILRIKENRKLVSDAFNQKQVVTPAPTPVVTPKVVAPKPVKVVTPKPVKVEKPKPVKVEKPKPIKQTKPKVEDDLSFLNDLDNIF
jgi:hypothetical protein